MARILLIEPDTILAGIYAKALKHDGHKVMLAAGAQTAILAADKQQPELVIVELQLASHNGLEFLYEFRTYPDWQNIPVLIHSVVPPGEFKASAELTDGLNVAGYLYKPRTSLAQLLRVVNGQLSMLNVQ